VTGFAVLLRKELVESWRTLRLPVISGLFLGLGILSPVTARYLREIVNALAPSGIGLAIPPPVAADAVDQVVKNVGQFGALAAILLAMGTVATEKERGTAAFVLVKPATRTAFLAAKAVSLGAVLGIATLLGVLVAWAYTGWLFESQSLTNWLGLAAILWLSSAVYASITFLGSVLARSSLPAAGVGFAGLIVLAIASAVGPITRYLPAGLLAEGRGLVATSPLSAAAATPTAGTTDLPITVACSVALIVACLVAAWASFRRQEL
jgi:ABC-2 type transport system permease protein